MYHKKESKKEKGEREERVAEARESRQDRRQERNLTRVLAAFAGDKEIYRKGRGSRQRGSRQAGYLGNTGPKRPQNSRGPSQPPLDKDQCAYCKEKGHWARNCPKKKTDIRPSKVLTPKNND